MKTADLIWLGQRLAEAGREEMRALTPDVPTAELLIMGDLLDHPPSTITALAVRTGYAQSRVSTAVASLVRRGWAQTRSDPSDGRRTLVFVPDRVQREAQEFRVDSESRTLDRLLAGLSPTRRLAIASALQELLGLLLAQATDEPTTKNEVPRRELAPVLDSTKATAGRGRPASSRARR